MKILIVFTALILMGITSLIYIADMNKFSEAKAFVSNRTIEAMTLGENDINEIIYRCKKSFARSSNQSYLIQDIKISHVDNRIMIQIETEDYIRLPIIKLNSIKISMPLEMQTSISQ